MTRPPRLLTRAWWTRRLPNPTPLPATGWLDTIAVAVLVAIVLLGLRDTLPHTHWARVTAAAVTLGAGWAALLTRLGLSPDRVGHTLPFAYLCTAPPVVFGSYSLQHTLTTVTNTVTGWGYFLPADDAAHFTPHGGLVVTYLLGFLFAGYLSVAALGSTNPQRPVAGILALLVLVAWLVENTLTHTLAWTGLTFVLTTTWYAHRNTRHDQHTITTRRLRTRTTAAALLLALIAGLGAVTITPRLVSLTPPTTTPGTPPSTHPAPPGTAQAPTLILDGDWTINPHQQRPGPAPKRLTPTPPPTTKPNPSPTPPPTPRRTTPAQAPTPDATSSSPTRTGHHQDEPQSATGSPGSPGTKTKDAHPSTASRAKRPGPHSAADPGTDPAADTTSDNDRQPELTTRRLLTIILTALLVLTLTTIAALKRIRAWRRQHTGTTTQRIHGSWQELLDTARDLGTSTPPHTTRPAQARLLNLPRTTALAIDAAAFGPHHPRTSTTHWAQIATHKTNLRRHATWPRRLTAPINPASLCRRHRQSRDKRANR